MAGEGKTGEERAGVPGDSRGEPRESQAPTRLPDGPEKSSKGETASDLRTRDEGQIGTVFPQCTQTLELSDLFSMSVSTSGGFHAWGTRRTLLGNLLEAVPIPAFLIDHSNRITFVNDACRRIDNRYQAILGKPFASLFPVRAASEKAESVSESVFSTRKPRYHIAWLQINAGRIWARVTLRSLRIGPDRFLLALVEDLTSEKRRLQAVQQCNELLRAEIVKRHLAEETQSRIQQRFELALKGANLAWWDWQLEMGSLVCGSAFSRTLGYAADEIAPQKSSWEQLVHPDDVHRISAALRDHLNNGTSLIEVEHRVRSKSGAWKWVLTRGRVVERSESGEPRRAAGTNLDITGMKEAQERIRALTHAMIQAQERERERIAMDLHDQVGQDLSAVRLALQAVWDDVRSVKPELSDLIAGISEAVQSIAKDVRDLSYELLPPGLDELGLVSTVQQYSSEFSVKNGLAVEFHAEGIEGLQLDFDIQINLFRVIQEALTNAARHAHASNVVVRLMVSRSKIILSIIDDGKGFNVKEESAAAIADKRMGMWGMEQRIGLLQGTIDVASCPMGGTEIKVEVPFGEEDNVRQEERPDSR